MKMKRSAAGKRIVRFKSWLVFVLGLVFGGLAGLGAFVAMLSLPTHLPEIQFLPTILSGLTMPTGWQDIAQPLSLALSTAVGIGGAIAALTVAHAALNIAERQDSIESIRFIEEQRTRVFDAFSELALSIVGLNHAAARVAADFSDLVRANAKTVERECDEGPMEPDRYVVLNELYAALEQSRQKEGEQTPWAELRRAVHRFRLAIAQIGCVPAAGTVGTRHQRLAFDDDRSLKEAGEIIRRDLSSRTAGDENEPPTIDDLVEVLDDNAARSAGAVVQALLAAPIAIERRKLARQEPKHKSRFYMPPSIKTVDVTDWTLPRGNPLLVAGLLIAHGSDDERGVVNVGGAVIQHAIALIPDGKSIAEHFWSLADEMGASEYPVMTTVLGSRPNDREASPAGLLSPRSVLGNALAEFGQDYFSLYPNYEPEEHDPGEEAEYAPAEATA
ncbi:hypothetical protein TSO5_15870 [Azospirillum sp. TSO5]|nr:hypothetical protein TSO5_15870 [Azospirillum sp. TSO5]